MRNINENNVEVECKKKSYKNRNVKFYCEFTPKKKEIENIEVDEDFDFIDQEVNIKGCSPIARKHMKNLLDAGKNDIFKQKLYILESAEKSINKNSINIIGKINDKSFNSDKVTLTIVTSDNNDEKKIECTIESVRAKYKLVCEPKEDIDGELDAAIGQLEDENLIINFKKVKDSSFEFKYEKSEEEKDDDNDNEDKSKAQKIKRASKSENETPSKSSESPKASNEEKTSFFENEGLFSIKTVIFIVIGIIAILIIVIVYIILCKPRNYPEEKHLEESNSIGSSRYGSTSSESNRL